MLQDLLIAFFGLIALWVRKSPVAMQLEDDYARPFVAAIRNFKSKEACMALLKIAISNPTSLETIAS
ncbi:MAG: hypothetical protein NTY15_14150 [Planctomycetota bacterium]|nr:hypothetical protein [Planctomycetota bacterium]